tara:strand:+ start:585 stop:899 length:315 start_codon:yes stop_codon:yes gene_type:complete
MYSKTIDCQLTEWGQPESTIKSSHGHIFYYEWLRLEKKRIAADRTRMVEVRKREDGCFALFVNGFRWHINCPCEACVKFIPSFPRLVEEPPFVDERIKPVAKSL